MYMISHYNFSCMFILCILILSNHYIYHYCILTVFFSCLQITSLVTRNLNRIIDVNYYPVETARNSNMRHRPIGLGVQGLADAFILLGMPFDSEEVIRSHIY
jgi:hypothetical protein